MDDANGGGGANGVTKKFMYMNRKAPYSTTSSDSSA